MQSGNRYGFSAVSSIPASFHGRNAAVRRVAPDSGDQLKISPTKNMKPNITTPPQSIAHICAAFEVIEKSVADAEAAVITAKQACKDAKTDDGNTDPAKIYDRKAHAKKQLFILEAEAKRAAAKLEEAKPDFENSIGDLAAPLLDQLAKKRAHNAELLEKEFAPKTVPGDLRAKNAMSTFIACCKDVEVFDIAIGAIHQGLQRLPAHGAKVGGLTKALRHAESLI